MVVPGVVDATVVEPAQRDHVGEVGVAPATPGSSVVELAPGVRDLAAVGSAGGVAGGTGHALGLGEQPLGATEVEGLGLAAEHGGHEPGVAGQPTGLSRRDQVAGVEPGSAEVTAEGVEVEPDQDGGRGLAVEPVGGQVLEDLGEGEAASVCPVVCPVPLDSLVSCLGGARSETAAAGSGDRVEDLLEDRPGQRGHSEMAGESAVAVVVERQPGPGECGGLLVAELAVLVGVDDGCVVLDGGEGATSEAAELGRIDAPGLVDEASLDRGDLFAREPGRELCGGGRDDGCVVGGQLAVGECLRGGRQPVVEVRGQPYGSGGRGGAGRVCRDSQAPVEAQPASAARVVRPAAATSRSSSAWSRDRALASSAIVPA